MKKLILIAVIFTLSGFNFAFAQKANLNVAVIDVEEVLKNSTVVKYVKEKIASKEKIYQAEIDKEQKKLEKEFNRIKSKQSVLSDSAKKEEERKFAEKFNKLKSELDAKQKSLKKAYLESMTQIDKKVNEIVADISKSNNIDLILPSSQIISYQDELDISPLVLKRLNKDLKKVKINFN